MARRTKDTKKNKKKGTSFMRNVLVLMFSQIMVKILGFIYKLVITNFEGFGETLLFCFLLYFYFHFHFHFSFYLSFFFPKSEIAFGRHDLTDQVRAHDVRYTVQKLKYGLRMKSRPGIKINSLIFRNGKD